MPRKVTQEEFIARARKMHGEKYDYSRVRYVNSQTKVEIICPHHGSFWQEPKIHMKGSVCPKCADKQRIKKRRLTQEEFIARAREVHGDKFDYSRVLYENYTTKIEIVCPYHGSFYQTPNSHLNGSGCPKCANEKLSNMRRITQEEFIARAHKIHGDKYNYSRVIYKDSKTKVEIVCPHHGSFYQTPSDHLQGYGCPYCGGKVKLNTETFILKAREVHKGKYDYSKVRYKTAHEKIEIVCPYHGNFYQTPNSHLNGSGCPKCGREKCANARRLTQEEFIARAREVHGDKYDYKFVAYKNTHEKILIVCSYHGKFWQKPNDHLNGHECPKCGREKCANARRLTQEEFIARAREVHGDKYDYRLVAYKTAHEKIEIVCPYHGKFYQTPNSHLNGSGCPKCGREKCANARRLTQEEFIARSKELWGEDRWDYSFVEYKGSHTHVKLICKKCGNICYQKPNVHLNKAKRDPCVTCRPRSKKQQALFEYCVARAKKFDLDIEIWQNDRQIIKPKEIDIVIKTVNKKFGIEFNGFPYHSEEWMLESGYTKKEARYWHQDKTLEAMKKGVHIIHVFEDQYERKPEVIHSIIALAMGAPDRIVYARKLEIQELDWKDVKGWLSENHLYNSRPTKINLALVEPETNEIMAVMTFGKPMHTNAKHKFQYELVRYAPRLFTSVVGGPQRLWKYFLRKYNPESVVCYADASIFSGNLYRQLGFEYHGISEPCNWYITPDMQRLHRGNFTKAKLRAKGYEVDDSISAHENVKRLFPDWITVWDCGSHRFYWFRDKEGV